VLWILAGPAFDFMPYGKWAFLAMDVIGVPASMWSSYRTRHTASAEAERRYPARAGISSAAYMAFAIGPLFFFRLAAAPQITSCFALLIAALYVGIGNWIGPRYVVIGCALAAGASTIYWLHLPHGTTWVSLVGGITLIVGGLWMRRT